MKKQRQRNFSKQHPQTLAFTRRVYTVVKGIPPGKTMTYKEVATKAGNMRAARAVGILMSKNYDPKVPCHRVVRSDGTVGNYNRGGPGRKMELLLKERKGY